jgi:hypothetical protein
MPLIVETPVILAQVNRWSVKRLVIETEDEPYCEIHVRRMYDDGSTVRTVDIPTVTIAGAEFVEEFSALTSGGTLYHEVRARVYALLRARGVVPDGAVEA